MSLVVLIPILILVLIAVGLGLVVGFQKAVIPGTVEQSLGNLFTSKSFKLDGKIEADIQVTTEQGGQAAEASLGLVGVIDASDIENVKTSSNISIRFATEGLEFSLGGEIRTFGQNMYVKLTTLPAFVPFLQGLEAMKDQWFKIEGEKLKEMGGTNVPAPGEKEVEEILEGLKDLVKGKKLFEVDKDLGTEELDGEEVSHYLVSLNKNTLKELIPDFFQFMKQYIPAEQQQEYESSLQETLQDFPQKIDEAWVKIGGVSFEIWVGDGILKKFRWEKEIDLTSFEALRDKVEQGIVDLTVECKFSEINTKFKIEEPADFKPIEELLPGGMFGTQGAITPELPYSLPEYTPEMQSPEYTPVPEE